MWWPFAKKSAPTPDLVQLADNQDPDWQRLSGRRLLEMVGELHRQGYEGLRICPHMAPSGMFWRCYIVPRGRMRGACQFDSAQFRQLSPQATFSTANGYEPFGWQGVGAASAADWARHFLESFAQICSESRLKDPDYVRWYAEMLRKTNGLLVAWDDMDEYSPLRLACGSGTYPDPPF